MNINTSDNMTTNYKINNGYRNWLNIFLGTVALIHELDFDRFMSDLYQIIKRTIFDEFKYTHYTC